MFSIAAQGDFKKALYNSLQGRPEFMESLIQAVCGFKEGKNVSPHTFGCYGDGLTLVSSLL